MRRNAGEKGSGDIKTIDWVPELLRVQERRDLGANRKRQRAPD